MSTSDDRVFIIAEAGVNHNGSLSQAIRLAEVAKNAGADAVKYQTFHPEMVVTSSAKQAEYQIKNTGNTVSQLEMIRSLALSEKDHFQLKSVCEKLKIEFMTTPFDVKSLRFITRDLKVNRIKMASGEITHANLLFESAKTKLPIILSTGMSTLDEVTVALRILVAGYSDEDPSTVDFRSPVKLDLNQTTLLKKKVSLLHCVTEYPAPPESMNLTAISTLRREFDLPVGLSDHTNGWVISAAATALGAKIIEKHFTLDKNMEGPDHKASLSPDELKEMIRGIRDVTSAMGDGVKKPAQCELKNMEVARRSLVAAEKILKGEAFSEDNLTAKRPATGMSPMYHWKYLRSVSSKDYQKDDLINE